MIVDNVFYGVVVDKMVWYIIYCDGNGFFDKVVCFEVIGIYERVNENFV